MTGEEKRHRDILQQNKARKNGPLNPGVKKDAGEREYVEDAADALDNPEAGQSRRSEQR
ncbi:hypothetical protein [Falsigemmobacter faecalis]|uniref:hypothetical protein n=1 Tax=Falsigemmobacter faecalis TaxID=2488730 RepID=UPI00131513B9|nr:hypothetical protein [Falsigemmobacter faecalis]